MLLSLCIIGNIKFYDGVNRSENIIYIDNAKFGKTLGILMIESPGFCYFLSNEHFILLELYFYSLNILIIIF